MSKINLQFLFLALDNSSNITEDLVFLFAEIGVFYFNAAFVYHQKGIARVYTDLSDFENFQKPYHFDERNRRLILLYKAYKISLDIMAINIFTSPFYTWTLCERRNEHREFKEVCGFLATAWMPFDIDKFPMRYLLYFAQCFGMFFSLKGGATISFAIMESMQHLVIRIQHLKKMLTETVDISDVALRQKKFDECIKYHVNIFE